MIAMAMSCEPSILIADEPTTALDVTIQAQILDLIENIKKEFNTSIIYITHDLGVIAETVERIYVMYMGKVIESGSVKYIFSNPLHPYTDGLLAAVPVPDPVVESEREHKIVTGEVPSPMNPPPGCVFHPRCPMAVERCSQEIPALRELRPGHWVACTEV